GQGTVVAAGRWHAERMLDGEVRSPDAHHGRGRGEPEVLVANLADRARHGAHQSAGERVEGALRIRAEAVLVHLELAFGPDRQGRAVAHAKLQACPWTRPEAVARMDRAAGPHGRVQLLRAQAHGR